MNSDPKELFAQRLRQARTMRGLSLRGLSESVKGAVSHNALAKYEHGKMMPDSLVLAALSKALEQPPDFFFRPFTLRLSNLRYRKRDALRSKTQQALEQRALEYFERYHEIEEILGERPQFAGKLAMPPVTKPDEAEAAADRLRTDWQLGRDPLPNVIEMVEAHGIKVYEAETQDRAFDGFSAETEAGSVIVLAAWLNGNLLRKRMTTLHELAHLVLPVPADVPEHIEEAIAKRFAGALLLPRERFIAEFGTRRHMVSLAELIELKVSFGASIWAIMMRARELGLIADAVFERFLAIQRAWDLDRGEPGDDAYKGNETYSRFRQLVQRAASEDLISLSKAAALLNLGLDTFRRDLRQVFA